MQESDPPSWSLEDHLREGSKAIAAINIVDAERTQPICHHFSEVQPIDAMTASREEEYGHLTPIFADASVQFASDRLEAWETIRPNEDWLVQRITRLYQIASEHALIYEGWTWEPPGRQPIGACTFTVINNRSR
jgi:hypothetical protein